MLAELVHVSNGFLDLLGNQLTTAVVNVATDGRILEIRYANEAEDLQFEIFTANELGHINPGHVYRGEGMPVEDNLMVCFIVAKLF